MGHVDNIGRSQSHVHEKIAVPVPLRLDRLAINSKSSAWFLPMFKLETQLKCLVRRNSWSSNDRVLPMSSNVRTDKTKDLCVKNHVWISSAPVVKDGSCVIWIDCIEWAFTVDPMIERIEHVIDH